MVYTINLRKYRKLFILLGICAVVTGLAIGFVRLRYPLKYTEIVNENAEKYAIDPALVYAVIHAESKFESKAQSNRGANGLMQITETTGSWLAEEMGIEGYSVERLFEPEINIAIGCFYLNRLLEQYNNNREVALAAYNAGSGNVSKWLKDERYSDDGISLRYIPFKETRDYIKRVRVNLEVYKRFLREGI